MSRLYNEYIKVDTDFIPVFSRHSDKLFPNKWKSFYPHDSFKSIVSQLIDTLEMNSIEKNKPLWISGTYGTGKTYASFVIKHLLEDDLEDIKSYFETNNMMPLYARLCGLRNKGKILVVHRSSSSNIIGDNSLNNCIMESIKLALKENKCKYFGEKSQYETVLSTLKDVNSSFNFANVFNKYKAKFTEYASPESVIKDLEELDIDYSLELLETIVKVAEEESYVWKKSTQDMINWIDDVVKTNNLHSIVFIWDEFTEYFKNNQNNITGLQEIAMASPTIKFYFFLITHSTGSQLIHDQNSKKIIEARFKSPMIEMADNTAFKLMRQALKFNYDLSDEWEKASKDLWQRVQKNTNDTIIKYSNDIRETELADLLPLHPYATYLLKVISKDISSNQRTMFQFLSGEYLEGDNIKCNFRWFIDNHSYELNSWNYLTVDYIWDYFFTSENIDLDETFKNTISHYYNYRNLCKDDKEKERVLKVALFLTAMQQKNGADRARGLSGLLRPTLSNISACFVGTPIQSSIARIMSEFVIQNIFGKVEEINDVLYVPPLGNIDEERFNDMKDEIRKIMSFEKIINDPTYSIYDNFLPTTNDLLYRFNIGYITPGSYKNVVEQIVKDKPNKIPMFFMYAKNELEQSRVKSVIEKIYNENSCEVIVVDFSNQIMTDAMYDKFIVFKTEEKYNNTPNLKPQSDMAKQNAKELINEWKNKLNTTSINVYRAIDDIKKCQGSANLRKIIKEINSSIFTCGLEQVAVHNNLFLPTKFTADVAQMAMSKKEISSTYSYLNNISNRLVNDGIWNDVEYYINNPSNVVSQMKITIEKFIKASFEKDSKVKIIDIWRILEDKPFGLLCCSGSVFLMGFLLKEYADGTYYIFDGANTVNLNFINLSDLIFGAVKDDAKIKSQFIVKQTPEHIEFCKITGNIFKISIDKQNSIDDISKNIKVFLQNNKYPLWSLKNYINEELTNGYKEELIKAIELLCEFIASGNMAGRDKTKVAEDLYTLYKLNSGLAEELEKIVKVESLKLGMKYYMVNHIPELAMISRSLDLTSDDYVLALNEKISSDASYLWLVGDINKQIDNLYEDYVFIDSINGILSEKRKSFIACSTAVKEKLNIIRLPKNLLIEENKQLENILKLLDLIVKNNVANKEEAINVLKCYKEEFNNFLENQYAIFSDVIKKKLNANIENDEIEYLFRNVNSDSYYQQIDIFIQNINIQLAKYRQNKKNNKLNTIWLKTTNSETPFSWSEKHSIPILCLFQEDSEKAQKAFNIINKTDTSFSEKEIDEAIKYIESQALKKLENLDDCNQIFREYFTGEYELIIDDIDELKKVIKQSVHCRVYDWILKKKSIDDSVKTLADKKYSSIYKEKVKRKIRELSPQKAQEYLESLIEDKPLVGINILKE